MMYESPIQMMIGEIQSQMDENIARVVQKVAISVDKDELVKALNYDRGQYEKGYTDGKNDVVAHGHWEFKDDFGNKDYDFVAICSRCGNKKNASGYSHSEWRAEWLYCNACGAKMDE